MLDYTFHWRSAFQALPDLLAGAWVTMQTAVLAMVLGMVLGLLLTAMRRAKNPLLRGFAEAWVSIARNTPSLFQIYILYFGLGSFNIQVGSWAALMAGITFNNAGYLAEIFRGGLKAIPDTQVRAARSLGMNAFQAYRLIVVPQLLRVVFHPLSNQMVWSVLMTSAGVIVGLNNDLTGVTQELNVRTFRTFEFFALAAALYYLIAKAIVVGARIVGWRLFRY
ncbi:amino acid ABC transporter permease [Pseudomonas sp. SDO528_S397]